MKLRYLFQHEFGDFQPEDIDADHGGTDALMIVSIRYLDDGGMSIQAVSVDGRSRDPMTMDEAWKAWVGMADGFARDDALPSDKRDICAAVLRDAISAVYTHRVICTSGDAS